MVSTQQREEEGGKTHNSGCLPAHTARRTPRGREATAPWHHRGGVNFMLSSRTPPPPLLPVRSPTHPTHNHNQQHTDAIHVFTRSTKCKGTPPRRTRARGIPIPLLLLLARALLTSCALRFPPCVAIGQHGGHGKPTVGYFQGTYDAFGGANALFLCHSSTAAVQQYLVCCVQQQWSAASGNATSSQEDGV